MVKIKHFWTPINLSSRQKYKFGLNNQIESKLKLLGPNYLNLNNKDQSVILGVVWEHHKVGRKYHFAL